MTIRVIGHGYVGLVTACVFADLGNKVYCIGRNKTKLEKLRHGDPLIFEPGLEELLKNNLKAERLTFTDDYNVPISESEIIFIAVGTPSRNNGEADLSSIYSVVQTLAPNLNKNYTIVSCKSTVPLRTNRTIEKLIKKLNPKANIDVASCPEFLREGTALNYTFSPDRIVIGSDSQKAINKLLELHKPLQGRRVIVKLESAEIIKYASNSFLAMKISFANFVAMLCEKTNANVTQVLEGVGLDQRIGQQFLYPGIGYGGSCFPKDVKALISTGQALEIDVTLLKSVEKINQIVKKIFLAKIKKCVKGRKVAIWGLAFKPNTDDIRDAPSIHIIDELVRSGYSIKAYDPEATANFKNYIGEKVKFMNDPYDACDNMDALLILTEWNEFKQADLKRVKKMLNKSLIIDGRNIYEKDRLVKLGFQ